MLYLTNTLTGKKEEFKPILADQVGMYNCGPTVYDYAHIGNLRAYVFADTLRRTLEYLGYKVHQVVNVTDIGHLVSDGDEGEDKMTKALKREGKPMTLEAMREVADFYFEAFKRDLKLLNIEEPEQFPFASDHIADDIALIQKLSDRDFTYETTDGIYFDTSKISDYGKLGGFTAKLESGHSRIGLNPEKKNSRDFALWKFNAELGYDTPFGKGFPGWHIECSAMSMKYLGETFDIHTGGIDHIPVHHNNEIAQSESATGKPFVNYWIHNAFVNMPDGKMAKSDENFVRLSTLEEKKIQPLAYRYWLLQAKYSTKVEFSWETLQGVQNGFKKLINDVHNLPNDGKINKSYLEKFKTAISDDLNTPETLALIQKLLKDGDVENASKKATILEFDKVLGLKFGELIFEDNLINIEILPQNIQALIAKREEARKNKDWKKSDEIRDEINKLGYQIEDSTEGPKISALK
jgi:cysteinyl-tRNA synthetase